MNYLSTLLKSRERLATSLVLAATVLLAAWMGRSPSLWSVVATSLLTGYVA